MGQSIATKGCWLEPVAVEWNTDVQRVSREVGQTRSLDEAESHTVPLTGE